MARRKSGGGEGDSGPNWMDTYGDMITLIMCFFVLLYSMSNMDESKWQIIAQSFATGKGDIINVVVSSEEKIDRDEEAVYVDEESTENAEEIDFEDFFTYLKEAVSSAGLDESVSVEMAKTGVYMKFRDSVFFAGDSDELLEEGQYILEIICDGIRAVDDHILSIKVSGHTAESTGSDANEWRLSSGRADSVINYMLSLDCCDADKFQSAGYGKYRPVVANDTPENRSINRRVEIVFVRNDVDFEDPAVIEELFELEFGSSFAGYSDSEGGDVVTMAPSEEPDSPSRSDPDRDYVSKDDVLSTLPHDIPGLREDEESEEKS